MSKPFKIAVLTGGPSLERGISLNSARSVCDHLHSDNLEVVPYYFDHKTQPYKISRDQLYSNTPSDFDFKLKQSTKVLSNKEFIKQLKSLDLVFPAMHGPFGEDGQVQALLEEAKIPFVGAGAESCRLAFDKFKSSSFLKENGFNCVESALLSADHKDLKSRIGQFFKQHKRQSYIVKPTTGGSSVAVYVVKSVEEALIAAKSIFASGIYKRAVLEPFLAGREFTIIIVENRLGLPVGILPTEIELDKRDFQIFDYRKKYLATRQVTYHCPPRFRDKQIDSIQIQAEQLFRLFKMRDFARFDGWILEDNSIVFTDFNPISGMEQNSFLFMQAARLGLTHRATLRYVLESACRRYGLALPEDTESRSKNRKVVNVIFGGNSAERQVSLMSGTNVWLKLQRSKTYESKPFLLAPDGKVWRIPYAFALNHSVEEVYQMCKHAKRDEARLRQLKDRVLERLLLHSLPSEPIFVPESMSLKDFIKRSNIVFLGLHGGIGEDGTLQSMLERSKVPFNGPGSKASRLCMDKFKTGQALADLESHGIYIAPKCIMYLADFSAKKIAKIWQSLLDRLGSKSVIVKPIDDGCSAGIARLFSAKDLAVYVSAAKSMQPSIAAGMLSEQHGIIEMPAQKMKRLLFEHFVESDKIRVVGDKLECQELSSWIEVTVGVLQHGKKLHALNPSITVALGNVLSLEEKFQGGTGVNITPPPSSLVSKQVLESARKRIELVAAKLGLSGYSRIDAFMNRLSGELIIIEANTLPGLTASTVIFHQALAEEPGIYPVQFLEKILEHAEMRYRL